MTKPTATHLPFSARKATLVAVLLVQIARIHVDACAQSGGGSPPAVASSPGLSPQGFLSDLERLLRVLKDSRVASGPATDGILGEFRAFDARNHETLRLPGFEYSIPSVRPLQPESADNAQPDAAPARPAHEILGTRTVTEEDLPETYRRMFAPTKEDGVHFETFVKEAYLALVQQGRFLNPDGTVDGKAVSESLERDRATYRIVAASLEGMHKDGSGKRLASAITSMLAYSERKGLAYEPVKLRAALVRMRMCLAAKSGTDPRLYAPSCGSMMTWTGERGQAGAVEAQIYNPETGRAGPRYALVPWDAAYAREVYGPVFTATQAESNDAFWRAHFELYVGTARSNEAELNAGYSAALLRLETAVGRAMKLLLNLAQGTSFEGKNVTVPEARAALEDARRIKSALEATASVAFKARAGYADTMRGFEQVQARARSAGMR